MSYKRVVERDGKKYGPYVYESYRDKNGNVRKRYLGKIREKRGLPACTLFILGIFIFLTLFVISYTTNLLSFHYEISESVSGFFGNIQNSFVGLVVGENISQEKNETPSVQDNFSSENLLVNENISEDFFEDLEFLENETLIYENISEEIVENQTFLYENFSNDTGMNQTFENISDEKLLGDNLLNVSNETTKNTSEVSTLQYRAVIGRPVKWVKKFNVTKVDNLSFEIPMGSKNISVLTDEEVDNIDTEIDSYDDLVEGADREEVVSGNIVTGSVALDIKNSRGYFTRFLNWIDSFGISGNVVFEDELEDRGDIVDLDNVTLVDISDVVEEADAEQVAIEYYTEAPIANEMNLSNGKRVIVSAPTELNYSEVLAYTLIDSQISVDENVLEIYWYDNFDSNKNNLLEEVSGLLNGVAPEGVKKKIEYVPYDFDEDGFIDYVEWIVPHLSVQVYDVVIRIKGAEHLDSDRFFIKNIFNETNKKDDIWAGVDNLEYVRVAFEKKLDETRDITIYAKGNNSRLEVYRENDSQLIASFEDIDSEGYYKVFLDGLEEEEFVDVFDIRVFGSVEFDYIVDPINSIEFVFPTPENNSVRSSPVGINVSLSGDLNKFVWNWNGTNYTLFNDSVIVYMNFDNRFALGENDSIFKDISSRNETGICGGGNCPNWNVSGKYGGAYDFDGVGTNGDRVDVPIPFYNYTDFTYSVWINSKNGSGYNCFFDLDFHEQYIGILDNQYYLFGRCDSTFGDFSDNVWHHVVWTVSGSSWYVYEDGILEGSGGGCSANNEASYMSIGARNFTTTNGFYGEIDEVIFLNRSVSLAEVQMLYMSGLTKIGPDSYSAYINQSKNATSQLDEGAYSYQAFASDEVGVWNSSEQRNVIITTSCNSCSSCNSIISSAVAGDFIALNGSILNEVGSCIYFNGKQNLTFDCGGYVITGDGIGDWDNAIVLNASAHYNTVQNCHNISGFNRTVYVASDYNVFRNISSTDIDDICLLLVDSNYNRFENISCNLTGFPTAFSNGIFSRSDSSYNNFTNITIIWPSSASGIALENASGDIFRNIVLSNSSDGINFIDINVNNSFDNFEISNCEGNGIYMMGSGNDYNNFSNMRIHHNDDDGIMLGGDRNRFVNMTLYNNLNRGIYLDSADYNIFENINLSFNNDSVQNYHGDYNSFNNINSSSGIYGIRFYSGAVYNNVTNSYFINNSLAGVYFDSASSEPNGSLFYNNFFNNSGTYGNIRIDDNVGANYFNTTLNCSAGLNIIGGSCVGGNYYANSSGTGFSETCVDANENGICDSFYNMSVTGSTIVDYHPLAEASPSFINIEFISAPQNGSVTTNLSIGMNVSINSSNLNKVIWNWDGVNYSIYNNSLILMYNFDNVSALGECTIQNGNCVKDLSGNENNGTLGNSTTGVIPTWISNGRYGGAFSFDGIDDFLWLNHSEEFNTTEGSVGLWFKSDNIPDGRYLGIFSKDSSGFDTGGHFTIYVRKDVNYNNRQVINVRLQNSTNSSELAFYTIELNKWYHVLSTFGSSGHKLYVNGILVDENLEHKQGMEGNYQPVGIGAATSSSGNFTIYNLTGFFSGSIDEIRVWNRSLNSNEVAQMYFSNLNKYDDEKWMLYTNESYEEPFGSKIYDYFAVAMDSFGSVNYSDIMRVNISAILPQIEFVAPTSANGTLVGDDFVGVNVTIVESNLDEVIWNWNGTNYSVYDDSLMLSYNFNNVSALGECTIQGGLCVKDLAGYENNGTLGNSTPGTAPIWNASGKYGGAYDFDGADGFIKVKYSPDIDIYGKSQLSLGAWVYARSFGENGYGRIFDKTNSTDSTVGVGYSLHFSNVSNNIEITGVVKSVVSPAYYRTNNSGFPINSWHYVVMVYNGTGDNSIDIYLDGQIINDFIYNDSGVGEILDDRAIDLEIGNHLSNRTFDGMIDEVRIWNRSLSANEISQMYFLNLNKYDSDKWRLYVNESNLSLGSYDYFSSVIDGGGNENSTEERIVIIATSCYNCSDCSAKVQNAGVGDIVFLTADVLNQDEDCIEFNWKDSVTFDCGGHILNGDGDWTGNGISLNDSSNNNKIQNCENISGFRNGIYLSASNNNTIKNMTVIDNFRNGVIFLSSNFNFVNNTNFSNNNYYGIELSSSDNNIILDSFFLENEIYDIIVLPTNNADCNNWFSNVSVSGGRSFGYYNESSLIEDQVFSHLILCNADNSVLDNITIIGSDSLDNNVIRLVRTDGSNVSNLNSSNNYYGLVLLNSFNNSIVNFSAESNNEAGLYLDGANGNNFSNVNISDSNYGVYFYSDSDNNDFSNSRFYNNSLAGIFIPFSGVTFSTGNLFYNNFFNNTINVNSTNGSNQNFWNKTKTWGTNIIGGSYIGGNFWTSLDGMGWSDNCTDVSGDGICEGEYNISINNTDWLVLTYNENVSPIISFAFPQNNSYFYNNYTGYVNVSINENGGNCSLNDSRWDYSSGNLTFFSFRNNTAFNSNETINLNVSCWDNSNNNASNVLVFNVNVTGVAGNSAPILGDIDNSIFVCEGESLNYEFNATDVDDDDLTEDVYPTNNLFYSNSLGRVGSLSSFNIISGVLDKADVGDYEETISVSDPDLLVDSVDVNITVIEINNPPVMTGLGAQTVWLTGDNSTFYHQMNVSDTESVDGEFSFNLTWGASENLFDINSTTGIMNYSSIVGHLGGPYSLTVCVQDEGLVGPHQNISLCAPSTGNAESVCDDFTLTVTNSNRAPQLSNYTPSENFSVAGTSSSNFYVEVYDSDGTIPDIDWYVDEVLQEHNENISNDSFSYSFGCDVSGTHVVKIVTSDGLVNASNLWGVSVNLVACSSSPPSSSGGPSGGPGVNYCIENWSCEDWNVCQNVARLYEGKNLSLEDYISKKEICAQNNYVEEGVCGFQTRICKDLSGCGNSVPRIAKPNEENTCYFTENPGCEDGISNCHDGGCEVGIDCGGPCVACPTCSDGKKNQEEVGIDCGGPCPSPCKVEDPSRVMIRVLVGIALLLISLILFIIWRVYFILRKNPNKHLEEYGKLKQEDRISL